MEERKESVKEVKTSGKDDVLNGAKGERDGERKGECDGESKCEKNGQKQDERETGRDGERECESGGGDVRSKERENDESDDEERDNDDDNTCGRVCLVSGECGSGRSSLATLLATSWGCMDQQIPGLTQFQATIVTSSRALTNASRKCCLTKVLLPLSSLTHGTHNIHTWLLSSPVLLIIDDADHMDEKRAAEINRLVSQSEALSVMLLTEPTASEKKLSGIFSGLVSSRLYLHGYDREELLIVARDYLAEFSPTTDFKILKKFLTKNMCRLIKAVRFPRCLIQLCQAFASDAELVSEASTTTDLLWQLTWWGINKILESLPKEDNSRKKGEAWMMAAGRAAAHALRANTRLEGTHITELQQATSKLFTSKQAAQLLPTVLAVRRYHGCLQTDYTSQHSLQEQFLAAWYSGHQVVCGRSLHSIVGRPGGVGQVALFMGGLIPKVRREKGGLLQELDERRLVCAILNHTEVSSENLEFNFDLVVEVKATPQLLEYIVEGSEYPDEWNISVATVQLTPIQALLLNVSPTRIFLNVEKYKIYSELSIVIEFLLRVDIWVWLDSVSQFRYGDPGKLDRVVKGFLNDKAVTKVDLLCGCLSSRVLKELPSHPAMTHLVYLKLRVLDIAMLTTTLLTNKYLPKLLWLEVKIDFPILDLPEEKVRALPSCTAEMMDIHLQGVQDNEVSKLSTLLASIHTHYSGIHLHHTTLIPEGVYALLKQLHKLGVTLKSPSASRAKFRRWYYPQLSSCDPNTDINDQLALELLGFDDRIYYANHHIYSSCYAVTIDAWNLMNFLEEAEEIVHFTYTTTNLEFTKQLDGSVTVHQHTDDQHDHHNNNNNNNTAATKHT
ncbi:hypothetical protein Pcinc_043084 [Petrolisthes cinctipes]|uniref:NACHT domain-containing protein n=1 Tax=Petrolisthes cinctipes TaxID=88211 RepID=A0AAE1BI97_PETCI|nr:hypothetical protein Pcinc_043084 [Petrolisthes cinctipes]